jgi:hypothetical protein
MAEVVEELAEGPVTGVPAPDPALVALLVAVDHGRFTLLDRLVATSGRPPVVAVCANALDHSRGDGRSIRLQRTFADLVAHGLEPVELDLRDLTGPGTARLLEHCAAVWFCGGSAFWLAHMLHRDDAATALHEALSHGLVLGADSTACAVVGSSLDTVRLMDDPELVPRQPEPLGLVQAAVLPHANDLVRTQPSARLLERMDAQGHKLVPLVDGQVLVAADGSLSVQSL